jgi:hypothetical protein
MRTIEILCGLSMLAVSISLSVVGLVACCYGPLGALVGAAVFAGSLTLAWQAGAVVAGN